MKWHGVNVSEIQRADPNQELGVGEVVGVTNDNSEVRFAQRVVKLNAAVAFGRSWRTAEARWP